MRQINNFCVLTIVAIALLFGAARSFAEEVVITPGYIAGTVAMGDLETYNISTNAIGGGYTSSKTTYDSADYQLTVQGGGWDYTITTSANVRDANATTNVSFTTRTFPVGPGQTVDNDYVYNVGVIRFHVAITGDVYGSWRGYSKGWKANSPGQEKTWSNTYTSNFYENGSWEMPVVANTQIPVTASVTVSDAVYSSRSFSYDFGVMDVAPGQEIDLYIDIAYEKTDPPEYTGGGSGGGYYDDCNMTLSVHGAVLLNHIAPEDFLYHRVEGPYGGSRLRGIKGVWNSSENPGYYEREYYYNIHNSRYLDKGSLYPYTYFTNGSLRWPYVDGNPENNKVSWTHTGDWLQTAIMDFTQDSGVMEGKLRLTGTVNNNDLDKFEMQVKGITSYGLDPITGKYGSLNTPTSYGLATYTKTPQNMDEDYRVYLTEGTWEPYYFTATRQQPDNSGKTEITFTDYRHKTATSYSSGEAVDILAGETVHQDFDYCVGSLILRFRDASGAPMSLPRASASGSRRDADNKLELSASISGQNYQNNAASPELEFFGPAADYSISYIYAYTADGTYITFPNMQQQIECNVTKYLDIPGPDIVVTAPQNNLITNSASVMVVGVAPGMTQDSVLTINNQVVPFGPNGNEFAYDLALADGVNGIVTTITDTTGAQASDERKVYVDRWQPEVSITTPTEGQLVWHEDAVTAMVDVADRGYGYSMNFYLDGQLIQQRNGEGDDTMAVSTSYPVGLGILPVGDHTLSVDVVDLAGNSNSADRTFTVYMDITPPVSTSSIAGSIGNNNWYVSGVNVNISASDDNTGVKEIHYTINGVESVVPGYLADLTLTQDGIYDLTYWAVDNSDNVETPNTLQVKVDQTGPVVTVTGAENGGTYSVCEPPTPGHTATDNLSGIASDGDNLVVSGDTHNYTVNVTDIAGNTTSVATVYNLVQVYSIDLGAPLNLDRPFNLGSTIPIKFTMTNCYGNEVNGHTVSLTLQKMSGEEPVGDPLDGTSNVPDTDNLFRGGDMGVYIYNLATTPLSLGSWMATVTFETGQQETIGIKLR